MTKYRHLFLAAISILFGIGMSAIPVAAQQASQRTAVDHTAMGSVDIEQSGAAHWALDEAEWERYTVLMQGEAGLHYRHLDPSFVLGMYAETEDEQMEFAKRYYAREKARLDKLFAFNRAYINHSTEVDGNKSLIDPMLRIEHDMNRGIAPRPLSSGVSLQSVNNRYVVFVKRNCARCDKAIKRLVDARRKFEVYYSGATTTEEIRTWASILKIPAERVTSGDISLNFDQGYSDQLGLTDFPTIYKNIGLDVKLSVDEAVNNAQ